MTKKELAECLAVNKFTKNDLLTMLSIHIENSINRSDLVNKKKLNLIEKELYEATGRVGIIAVRSLVSNR